MRPSQIVLLSTLFGAGLIGLSFILTRLDRASLNTQPAVSPDPLPFVAPTPQRMTIEDFVTQYFEALNKHDFDTAYAFLSPAWGVGPVEFGRYWSKFKAGSIRSEILTISYPSAKSAIVKLRWSGNHSGKTVSVNFLCSLRTTPSSYRIEQCK